MSHSIGVVTYASSALTWVLDLPGCCTGAPDLAEAMAKLPLAIAEYEAWLAGHGESGGPPDTGACIVTETVDAGS